MTSGLVDEPVWARTVYPVHGSDRWAVHERGYTRFVDGAGRVRSALRRWMPAHTLLVGVPGAPCFRVPTEVVQEGVSQAAQRAACRHHLLLAWMTFLFAVPGLLLSAWIRYFDSPLHWFSVSLLVCSLIQFCDVRFHLSRHDHLHERAEFFYWLYRESRAGFGAGVCLGLLIVMGGLQWGLMYSSGDPRSVFEAYGLFYGKVVEGEAWRLLTGPYLHYSEAHIALNGVLFVLLGGLAWALKGSVSILFFAAACSVSLTAQMLFGGDLFDNAGGISGGVYALAGLVLGGTLVPSGRLPPGLAPQIFVIVVLSTLLAELESEAAGTVAHFTGLGFGILIGAVLSLTQRYRQQLAVSKATTGSSFDTSISPS